MVGPDRGDAGRLPRPDRFGDRAAAGDRTYFDPARAISYAEEVIVYLVIWAIMIVSSQLVRRDGHVRPDLVLRLLPPRYLRLVEIFNCLVAVVFCGALLWYGWQIVDTSLLIDETSSTDLQFPMWIYYLALPVGSALMLLRYLMRLVRFTLYSTQLR
jgi:C4-dicarboxylate transporter DctQ subunit